MNNNFNFPSDEEFFQWLASEREFGLNYLLKNFSKLSWEDAEDIFGEMCVQQSAAGCSRAQLMERGVLVQRLRWKAVEWINRSNAARRGSGITPDEISEVEERLLCDDSDALADLMRDSEWSLLVELLREVCPSCNHRQEIFARTASNVLFGEISCSHWWEAFSREQRVEFMTNSQGVLDEDEATFRREVNRACRQVTKKLVKMVRTKNVLWSN